MRIPMLAKHLSEIVEKECAPFGFAYSVIVSQGPDKRGLVRLTIMTGDSVSIRVMPALPDTLLEKATGDLEQVAIIFDWYEEFYVFLKKMLQPLSCDTPIQQQL